MNMLSPQRLNVICTEEKEKMEYRIYGILSLIRLWRKMIVNLARYHYSLTASVSFCLIFYLFPPLFCFQHQKISLKSLGLNGTIAVCFKVISNEISCVLDGDEPLPCTCKRNNTVKLFLHALHLLFCFFFNSALEMCEFFIIYMIRTVIGLSGFKVPIFVGWDFILYSASRNRCGIGWIALYVNSVVLVENDTRYFGFGLLCFVCKQCTEQNILFSITPVYCKCENSLVISPIKRVNTEFLCKNFVV